MIGKYLPLLLLVILIACKKDKEPAPDLTRDLVGVYQASSSQTYQDKFTVTATIRWTIERISDNMIRLKHREEYTVEGEGWEEYFEPTPPKEVTFDNIELSAADKFHVLRKIEWPTSGELQTSDIEINAVLAGKHLDVNLKEIIDGNTFQGDLLMKRQ